MMPYSMGGAKVEEGPALQVPRKGWPASCSQTREMPVVEQQNAGGTRVVFQSSGQARKIGCRRSWIFLNCKPFCILCTMLE